jgi:hypothetical protein
MKDTLNNKLVETSERLALPTGESGRDERP